MNTTSDTLPDDIDTLKAALLAERAARREFEACASDAEVMVVRLKLLIAKMKRDRFGASAERGCKLLDQLEMQLEELETAAAEDEVAASTAVPDNTTVRPFTRARPVRARLPAHLPRERVVPPSPTKCPCCGGTLAKLGETITETVESIPRSYKVIQTVREKCSCRSCETITQPPAPFHIIAGSRAGPDLLATIMHAKFGEHQPLNRQSERFFREGIDLSVSTLADWIGACTTVLSPLVTLIQAHVLAAERLQGDEPQCRCWPKTRLSPADYGPMCATTSRAAPRHPRRRSSTTRATAPASIRADISRITQYSAGRWYAGFNELYHPVRKPGPILEAGCWAHGGPKLFVLADVAKAPLAIEAVRRIDGIFDIERDINGLPAAQRQALRQVRAAPLVASLEAWMRGERGKLSRHADVAKAMDYMLKRWAVFTRFLNAGFV